MNRIRYCLMVLTLAIMVGCSTSPYKNGYPSKEGWVVLPVQSRQSEETGIQVERMLKVLLASKGIQHVELPPETEAHSTNRILESAHRFQNAVTWAEQHNFRLGMTGTVDDVFTDDTGRFHLILTLNLIDIRTGETVWRTNGQAEGKPNEDPYTVGRNLLSALINSLPLVEHR